MRPLSQLLVCLCFCAPFVLLADVEGQSAAALIKLQDRFPGKSWRQVSSLKEAGWSKDALAAAQRYASTDSIHTSAVMVVQGGEVVAQWGDFDKKIDTYSIRKSLLSALVRNLRG